MPLTLACALQQNFSIAHSPNIGLIILSSCYRHAVCCRIQTHAKHRAWTKEGKSNLKGLKVRICLITSMNPRQDATSVLGEGELAVILLCLSLHLVLGLPAFIICVSRVFKVNVPQVISQII